jgi:outer membrane protein insertion porin family
VEGLKPLSLLAAWMATAAAAGTPGGAATAPGAEAPARPVVDSVRLVLPPGEDAAALEPLVAVRPGQPLAVPELQRTVQALYQTGRFGNVVVREWPVEGPDGGRRVRLEVQCLPRRVVASVRAEVPADSPMSAEALQQAAALPRGAELYPGRLEMAAAAVRRALQRKGWRDATVTARAEGEPQAAVVLVVHPGMPTRVASLALGPDTGVPGDELRQALSLRVGSVLDDDALEADVREIRDRLRRAGYYRARVGVPVVSAAGVAASVSIGIEAGPCMEFVFTGDLPLPSARLRERLGYEGEVPLDDTAIEGAAERLREFLAALGFAEARVWTSEDGDARRVKVVFHVEAGRRYELRDVRFEGEAFRTEDWLVSALMEALAEEPPLDVAQPRADLDALALASGLAVRDPATRLPTSAARAYQAAAWTRALQRLVDGYRGEGFLDAALEVFRVTLDARLGFVDVDVRVREGVRTFVEEVTFDGDGTLPAADLLKGSRVKPGGGLSLVAVEETRRAIGDAYIRRGYVYARVAASESYVPDRTRATVRYRVDTGPQVRIAAVVVEGNKRTRTALIVRTLGVQPGQVYDPMEVATAQTELLRLGVFRTVTLQLSDPDVPQASKELVVQVDERPYQALTLNAGLSFAEGPRAGVEYGRPNLGGNALELITRLKVNYPLELFRPDLVVYQPVERIEWLAEAGLRLPRFLDVRFVNFRADVVGQHKIQAAYELLRGALIVGADLTRLGAFSTSLTASLEVDEVGSKTACQSTFCLEASPEKARYLFPVGITTLFSLQPRLSLDFRDNAARPTTGVFAELTLDYSRSLGSEGARFLGIPGSAIYVNLIRLEGLVSAYFPLWRTVLAISGRAGRVFALNDASQTIGPKRFYLGGASTMRGYGVNEMIPEDVRPIVAEQTRNCASTLSGLGCTPEQARLVRDGIMLPSEGGQVFALLKVELRVPLTQATEIGIFADWGNLWLVPSALDLGMLRTNVGVGLRILTPVGPVAFDVGFNLRPEKAINEPVMAPHFAVGFF